MKQSRSPSSLNNLVAPAPCSPPGWVCFSDLGGGLQLFLLPEMAANPNATEVFHNGLFVLADLVNKYHVRDDVEKTSPTIAENDLHRWYPLERLTAPRLAHAIAVEVLDHPSDAALFASKVHVRKRLVEPYVGGDREWLDRWPSPVPPGI